MEDLKVKRKHINISRDEIREILQSFKPVFKWDEEYK